jgi:hypothetical protein
MKRPAIPAGELLDRGWLPFRAACGVLGVTPREMARRLREGTTERRQIAPGICLVRIA